MNHYLFGRLLAPLAFALAICGNAVQIQAALLIADPNATYTIDFDNSVTGVNNGTYTGAGFTPTPGAGQLNSGAWAVTGFEALVGGDLAFGGTKIDEAYARGASAGGIALLGLYGFDVSNGGTLNRAFGIQPSGSNWDPGTVTLRLQNTSGLEITEFDLSYRIYVRNDQGRANSFNFSHSADDTTYTPEAALDFVSPQGASSAPVSWVLTPKTITLTGLSIPNNGYYYLRWSGSNVSGSGARDEFALDDIVLSNIETASAPIPEPTTIVLAGLAVVLFLFPRRLTATANRGIISSMGG